LAQNLGVPASSDSEPGLRWVASIRFESVWKRYGDVTAVQNLNLACAEGEMLALLGPSGCGKSSTVKMAAGIEDVSSGEIFFGDRPVSRLAPAARNIAMVFEDYALYPHLTVRDNIAFPLAIRHLPAAEIKARVDKALDLLALQTFADRDVKMLSGGAQQRTAIGRALVRDPQLILFDEPLSHLDGDQKVHLRTEIKRLQKLSAVTSILVTHDQTEATAMSDRIAVMNQGVLQQVATPHDLYERPAAARRRRLGAAAGRTAHQAGAGHRRRGRCHRGRPAGACAAATRWPRRMASDRAILRAAR
jgi:ABC-type sugar transport system ATPase subunit